MKNSILQNKIFKTILALVFWIVVWYVIAFAIGKEVFLPFPHTVIKRFTVLSLTPEFFKTVVASLFRIIAGFVVGTLLGFLLAILTNYCYLAETIVSPFIRVIRATPVVSFILLAYLWLDNDTIPSFIAILMVAPIIWQNISAGLSNLDSNLSEMANVFKVKKSKQFYKIIFPQIIPYLYSGCMTSLGLAWKSGVAAEVISYPKVAIGKEMNEAKVLLETTDVFVWTLTLIVLSIIFEVLFKILFKKKAGIEEGNQND